MQEISQTTDRRSPEAVPTTEIRPEENTTSQISPPLAAEEKIGSPPDVSQPGSRSAQQDNVESLAPTARDLVQPSRRTGGGFFYGWLEAPSPCGGCLFPRALGRHGPEYRFHRRCLCKRPLYLRDLPRAWTREKSPRGRQLPREKGGPAGRNSIRSRTKFRLRLRRPRWKRPKRTWQTPSLQVRALEAQGSSMRWKLQHAMEDVNNQIALLRANVASLES